MEERTDRVLQTLNFHIRLSLLKWCPTTEIICVAQFKYALLKIWWRSCQLIYSAPTIFVNENELFMSTSDATKIQPHIIKNFHTLYLQGHWVKKNREKGEVNIEVVCEEEFGGVVLFQISFALLVWSPPGPVKSPHKFIKDENLFSIWKDWPRILKQLFI